MIKNVTLSMRLLPLVFAFCTAGCGKNKPTSQDELASRDASQSSTGQFSLLGLEESRANTHFIWLGPRQMDPEYYENMTRWMEGRSKAGATLWVDGESAKHIRRDLMFSNNERLMRLKVRNISAMYEDARSLAPELTSALENLKAVEGIDAVGRANPAARSDLLRLLALYTYGGLYTDVDNKYDFRMMGARPNLPRAKQMGPLPEGGLHAQTVYGRVTNNSIMFIAAPGDPIILSILNFAVEKRSSMSQVRIPRIPALDQTYRAEEAEYIVTETKVRSGGKLPEGLALDLRGVHRIVGTMTTTGPVFLREAAKGRVAGIVTKGDISSLPGAVSVQDGQHAAWATPEDGRIYEKREGAIAAAR